ncbi:hypothetical protein JYP46_15620 [Nitratireductor aquimarinus]|uniref:hypothetical protein n=1 Tax=Alphaproteobacteria TaxID=28211 RepID=UPI0019D3DC96|nr:MULTISPECIES: hypothetical protein [Alphaproteobacteria]MBN7758255.1 hypothetical protein [Nitratireductor aquimarinus]MBY6001016.1 hypothetical protein [Tritonibacter mobilis]MBY6023048.1 hypothetical protein [Nitratireductor sp. DP7N14-4]MDJ1464639.1 hypothetical protein [Nitratireductor sp. GZWM139]
MSKVTEEDFIRVNAFHDGELGKESEAFARRLEEEPALQAALAEIRDMSASLKALRPEPAAHPAGQNDNRFSWRWWASAAFAGSLALALFIALPKQPDTSGPDTALAVHESFAAQTYVAKDKTFRTIAGERSEDFPDLSAANLTLVAIRDLPYGTAAHFAGREGCRLTVVASNSSIETETSPGLQSAQWDVPDRFYRIFATDMDAGKFLAITDYLEQATRRMERPETVIALQDATARATSCG